jgi:hypothetical protein
MNRKTFTADALARRLKIHPRTVYKWCAKGLPYIQPRLGPRRFDMAVVKLWMQSEEVRNG